MNNHRKYTASGKLQFNSNNGKLHLHPLYLKIPKIQDTDEVFLNNNLLSVDMHDCVLVKHVTARRVVKSIASQEARSQYRFTVILQFEGSDQYISFEISNKQTALDLFEHIKSKHTQVIPVKTENVWDK